jgi:iron uptake system EfeUOB component EfeO/EfeM
MIDLKTAGCLALLAFNVNAANAAANVVSFQEPVKNYRSYLIEGIGQALAGARRLHDRAVAGDLQGAKAAWISARAGWERSEVFTAGFVPELDAQIDAWPNATSGFHAVETALFGAGRTAVEEYTTALVKHLDQLLGSLRDMPLAPQGLLDGAVRLAYEVGDSKADGGESRVSGTSLDDMRNNVAGISFAYRTIFAKSLQEADGKLATTVTMQLDRLIAIIGAPDLRRIDALALRRASEELVIALQSASNKLGLRRTALEPAAQ